MNLPKMRAAWLASIILLTCAMAFAQDNEPKYMTEGVATDPLNATYLVEGQAVNLVDGRQEAQAMTGSRTRTTTFAFGEPAFGDLDGDGDDDAALFLVQQTDGSGTFYYVAGSLNLKGEYRGMNAVFLGDRVAPQNLKISNGLIIANYADRRPEEPMATPPSVAKSKYLILREGELREIKPVSILTTSQCVSYP